MLTSVFVGSHAVNECLHRPSLPRPIGRFTAPEALLQRAASRRCRRRKWDFMSHSSSLSLSSSMIRARIMRASLAAQGRRRT